MTLYFVAFVVIIFITPAEETLLCSSNDEKPCIFPFEFYGKQYNACTTDWTFGNAWCKVDNSPPTYRSCRVCEEFLCSMDEKKPCDFPFEHEGKRYNACTYDAWSFFDRRVPWCIVNKSTTDRRFCSVCKEDFTTVSPLTGVYTSRSNQADTTSASTALQGKTTLSSEMLSTSKNTFINNMATSQRQDLLNSNSDYAIKVSAGVVSGVLLTVVIAFLIVRRFRHKKIIQIPEDKENELYEMNGGFRNTNIPNNLSANRSSTNTEQNEKANAQDAHTFSNEEAASQTVDNILYGET